MRLREHGAWSLIRPMLVRYLTADLRGLDAVAGACESEYGTIFLR